MANTVNGLPLLRATVILPKTGIWTADIQVQSGEQLSGEVVIVLAGLELRGTVEVGGPYRERGWYRVAAGALTWRNELEARAYRSEAGVKLSTVLADVAREADEDIQEDIATTRLGPAFVRFEDAAARTLDLTNPSGWYVDELGFTRAGVRPAVPYTLEYRVLDKRPDERRLLIAAEDITGLVPGAVLEGMEAATVRHELTPDSIRSHVYGDVGYGDRGLGAFKAMVEAVMYRTKYHRACEYRVVAATNTHVDVVPVRASQGFPDLKNVEMWCGSPGAAGTPAEGSRCVVQFLDGEPFRPFVSHFEGPSGDGFEPDEVVLAQGAGRVLRDGDVVMLTNFQTAPGGGPVASTGPGLGIISLDATNLAINQQAGAPGAGFSKVKA